MLYRINLLPYRERLQAVRRRRFAYLMAGALLAGVLLNAAGYGYLQYRQDIQQARNRVLRNGIAELDSRLDEIGLLNDKKRDFLEKRKLVQALQQQRFAAGALLDALSLNMPEGVVLTALESNGKAVSGGSLYSVAGKAESTAGVARLMRALAKDGQFSGVELATVESSEAVQAFAVRFRVPKPRAAEAGQNGAAE